ncbi:protein YvfG [Metabacillus indicus]|uniref:protein YvfG n=1 Tax=Metabacillus indicus TaxID=246786 RepID=UPI0024926592|nr:protein YvfG [Metabacillus indicus]
MSELFSVPFFVQNFKEHLKHNENQIPELDAMNRYYRSVVSTLVQDQLTKNSVVLKRIQNLDEAYNKVKSTLK